MRPQELTFDDAREVTSGESLLDKVRGVWRKLIGRKTHVAPEAEPDILIEDTLYGVTVRFTGKDEA